MCIRTEEAEEEIKEATEKELKAAEKQYKDVKQEKTRNDKLSKKISPMGAFLRGGV